MEPQDVGRVRAPDLADRLLSHGVSAVTTAEAAELLAVPPDQVRRRLHAPARRGQWVTPAHGLWIPVPPEFRTWGAPPGIEVVDILMRHMGVGYYVGWLSAAEIHGASHQAPQVFQVATSRHVRSRQAGRTRFVFMERVSVNDMPVVERQTRSGTARVATPEVTVLDVAADPDTAGGVDNAATVIAELADQSRLDIDALARAAASFPVTAGRRAGWILDRFSTGLELEPLREALHARTASPSLLDASGPNAGEVDPRWRLRINREVEEESW